MNAFPVRFRLLPLALLALIVFFGYLYVFDHDNLDQPAWSSSLVKTESLDGAPATHRIIGTGNEEPAINVTASTKVEQEVEAKHAKYKLDDTKPENPYKGQVVMVTASTGNNRFMSVPHVKEMVYENRRSYADRHGYEFIWANFTTYNISEEAPTYWNKIPVLQEAFVRYPNAEWIWWLDIDIILMNHSLNLWDHVLSPKAMERQAVLDQPLNQPGGGFSGWYTPPKYKWEDVNFIISSGGWGMNVGNFFMRRSRWSEWLLDLWTDPLYVKQGWTFPENDAWTHMYRHHPIVQKHTLCTPQRALNAYPAYNPLGEHWQEGDHSIHFAGCGSEKMCPERWQEYWEIREPYDVPEWILEQLDNGTAEIECVQKGEGLPH